jgi:hypothetical protein
MLSLAHLTLNEIPGTLAGWVAGVGLGVVLGRLGLGVRTRRRKETAHRP